ncbi:hypothetical protein MT997_17770 [Paenibacillus sp. OVF10]|nr:hypothetical protein MT997_17770 [Paenibacillus sp. OVF10]
MTSTDNIGTWSSVDLISCPKRSGCIKRSGISVNLRSKKFAARLLGPDKATDVAEVGPNNAWSPVRFASPSCALNSILPPNTPERGVANPVSVVTTGVK